MSDQPRSSAAPEKLTSMHAAALRRASATKRRPSNETTKTEPNLARNRKFESSSLQQGVRHELWTAQKKRVDGTRRLRRLLPL
jgi:hypothetical protein